jgi:hypothetical protein
MVSKFSNLYKRSLAVLAFLFALTNISYAQSAESSGGFPYFTVLAAAVGGGLIAFLIFKKMRSGANKMTAEDLPPPRTRPVSQRQKHERAVEPAETEPAETQAPQRTPAAAFDNESVRAKEHLRKKMQNLKFANLPIGTYTEIRPSNPYSELPFVDDGSLAAAIDTLLDENEESEEARGEALRAVSENRCKNSVDALAEAAFYDVSSHLRSRAVTMLTEFDHESVFEPILLACADPGREVRAAAARGLFKLSCSRADAWTRILESNDEYRMKNAVRAATEANIVKLSFDRLIHEDLKMSYEAFVLAALVVRSGETKQLFDTLGSHPDPTVKRAILHVLETFGDERVAEPISEILSKQLLTADLAEIAGDIMRRHEAVLLEAF